MFHIDLKTLKPILVIDDDNRQRAVRFTFVIIDPVRLIIYIHWC